MADHRSLSVVLSLIAVAHTAGADSTRLVSPLGVDTGDCKVDPCRTIQFAVSAADPGDTILVAPGLYEQNEPLSIQKPGLTLRGSGASSTTIRGNGHSNAVDVSASSFTIEGFTVTRAGTLGALPGSAAIFLNTHSAVGVGDWVVRRNILEGNGFGVALWNSLGGGTAVIENNLIAKNTFDGVDNEGHPRAILRNNTIVDNGWFGYSEDVGTGQHVIVNNIIARNGYVFASEACATCRLIPTGIRISSSTAISFNDVFDNAVGNYSTGYPGASDISVDPGFLDAGAGDYRLSSASPAVDAGTNLGAARVDLDGAPRPTDGDGDGSFTADMGAFELDGPLDTVPPVIAVTAQPADVWSPGGKPVSVAISGTVTDASGVNPEGAAYAILDEYGAPGTPHPLSLGSDGRFAFSVTLEAGRRGSDRDGRHYAITVSAQDGSGNPGVGATAVTVLHDRGN